MKVGFTGTQHGMTLAQLTSVRGLLEERKVDSVDFHYGDCIGADAEAFVQAKSLGYRTISHPPKVECKRAHTAAHITLAPKDYLERNHDIVDFVDILIAAPRGPETLRSGTWATVRYARKQGKDIHIVWPTGEVTLSAGGSV